MLWIEAIAHISKRGSSRKIKLEVVVRNKSDLIHPSAVY